MANKLGSLVVSLGLDAAEFTRGMTKGEYQAQQSTARIKSQFDGLTKYVAGLGIGAALVQSVRNTADYADELGKLAQKAGTTTEEVSRLAYAARQADVDNEQLAKGLRALGEDAQSGGEKLQALGISVTDSSGKTKSSAVLFRELASVIAAIEDPQRKAAVAAELLGEKLGPGLVPLLNQGADGLKDLADEAERFGRVVTDDAAKAAEQFNDNLTKLNEASAGLAATVGNSLIPWINSLINEFNTGIGAAGGFWKALSLGTINPFRDAASNIKVLREELSGLQGDRDRYVRAGSDTRAIDDAIRTTQSKLTYLTTLENQAKAARVVYSADDQSQAEAVRLGLATPAKPPRPSAASKPRSARSSAPGKESDYQRMLDDYATAEDNNRVKVIIQRLKDEEDAQKSLIALRRQGAIDELETLERRNVAHQNLVQSLIDDTPTQKLEKQREVMQILADEYERGRFGAVGSAEAIKLYSESSGTFLGTLVDGVKEVNATAESAGSIFGSWLQTAIEDGAKLSTVINGLIRDLVRLAIQKAVIEPAANAFTGFVTTALGSFDGGGYTGAGARSGGLDGKGGFMAMLHPNETVIDHTKGQGAGGVTVVQNVTIDARGADAGVEARIQVAMRQAKAEAVAEVSSRATRGGAYSKSLGRA